MIRYFENFNVDITNFNYFLGTLSKIIPIHPNNSLFACYINVSWQSWFHKYGCFLGTTFIITIGPYRIYRMILSNKKKKRFPRLTMIITIYSSNNIVILFGFFFLLHK
jgi:hypothetical protein